MLKVNKKRQITLPEEQCLMANINAGDQLEVFVDSPGVITLVKKQLGTAKGLFRGATVDQNLSDKDSLVSSIEK